MICPFNNTTYRKKLKINDGEGQIQTGENLKISQEVLNTASNIQEDISWTFITRSYREMFDIKREPEWIYQNNNMHDS